MTSELARADVEALHTLRERLTFTRLSDRGRLARELDRLFSRRARGADFAVKIATLSAAVESSAAKVEALRSLPLKIAYDAELPITKHRDEILNALASRQVIVLCGATGSGKTTQLPKFCLEAGRGALGLIGHTQPRRIAARAIAGRLASELGAHVGGAVGYQVRFDDRSGPDCRIKVLTDGVLLKELESDRYLYRYDTLIVDEAHERSLNIDLLLGVLKRLLTRRPELKLIVTSATIDPQKFAAFFDDAPIIEVSGRSYPVEVRYRPLIVDDEEAMESSADGEGAGCGELSLPEGVVAAVKELDRGARGDVLVFLPGEKQIRDCHEALSRAKLGNTEVLPLFSRLSTRDQERIFEGHAQRRVVLATNVAETSLTVPGIRNVIDSGLARISRYSVRGKVQRLPIERISKASADQRKGRCGREAEGVCIRLYDEEDFNARADFTSPEVLRTNLASVILRLATLGLGEPSEFPFIDPPDTRLVNDGYRLLQELKAVDDNRHVTALGRQIASLPVDPRLARMLIAAAHHACLAEMLIVASFLEVQDPRERPADAQAQADEAHAKFADPRSDFMAVLNLWNAFQERAAELSGSQLRKWHREHFLAFMRMREWQELHRQLRDAVEEIGLARNQTPADYANLHQAILTGFLGNIGALDEKREYLGARGGRFIVAPGTPLANKPPKWVVAGTIVETTRVFARMVANVEPEWIERAGEHLLKRTYFEPQWVEAKGFVGALESVALYGLTLASQRRVNYGSVAPKEARAIFVREALVEGRSSLRAEFLEVNRTLRRQVEALEAKIRRRDVLIDEQTQCEFYLARLPEHVHSVAALEKWLRGKPSAPESVTQSASERSAGANSLMMSLEDLMQRDVPEAGVDQFPDVLHAGGNELMLSYKFEPGQADDGATLTAPEPVLAVLSERQLAWAIPGWRLEKIISLLRALPKEQRKSLVPAPDAAERFMKEHGAAQDLSAALATWIGRESGRPCSVEQLLRLPVPEHLQINIRVISLDGKVLREGRDLIALRRAVRGAIVSAPAQAESPSLHRSWDFGDWQSERTVERQGVKFAVYPALQAQSEGVKLIECRSPAEAAAVSRRGLVRLALVTLGQQAKFVRGQVQGQRELSLLSQGVVDSKSLGEQIAERVFELTFFPAEQTPPRTQAEFEARLTAGRARVNEITERVIARVSEVCKTLRAIRLQTATLSAPGFKESLADIQGQLNELAPAGFIATLEAMQFEHLPRYLRALQRRLERLPGAVKRDVELLGSLKPFTAGIAQLTGKAAAQPELDKLRWMLQEYRVSLFAQDLKTALPVSDKRLAEQLRRAQEEANR